MKKLLALGVLVLVGVGIWLGGVRIVVIQPIGALPDGVTAVVAGLRNVRLIDSPDAICYRQQGGVSLLCRGVVGATIAREGKVLLRLPYSSFLFGLTGGPFRED